MKPFACAVIGLGSIGQGYDYALEDAQQCTLTHASGFAAHPGFELVAGVDPLDSERTRFEHKFDKPAYPDVGSMLRRHSIDVASIGTPTATHHRVFSEIIAARPRAVICEKPIAARVAEAQEMVDAAKRSNCALLVNYMRRYEPGVLTLKSLIQNGEFGEIYKGVVWYSKGLLNNGSHFIDLLRFMLGECQVVEVLAKGRKWAEVDPEPDVRLRFGRADVDFLALREECFSAADMELAGTGGRVYYHDSGAHIYARKPAASHLHPGYTALAPEPQTIPNEFPRYQWHVCDHLYRHLALGAPLNSDGESATGTLRVVEDIVLRLQA